MKNMVHFGFSAVILIMTVLAFIWLDKIEESNETVLELIEQFDSKIEHAHTMQSVVSRRYNLLLSMLIIDDPFVIDEKVTEFHELAFEYRKSRKVLHSMPMSDEEKQLHIHIDEVSSVPQQHNLQAVEMFRADAPRHEIEKVIKLAQKNQDELIATLEHFVELQAGKDDAAVEFSKKIFKDSVFWISFMGLFAFVISFFISRYVGQAVAAKNQQLIDVGKDMENAYKKAEEATVIKSEFLATMSHEIRTPLTAMIGFAETSLFDGQTKEQRAIATRKIVHNGKHLLQIINDILDLSKVEANKFEVDETELSLFELLADVNNLVKSAAEDKGLGFSINYIFPLPEKIISDALRIKQILINLCSNAIKFTETGHVLINVSCDQVKNTLTFEVVDSGIGIAENKHDVIFNVYQQADSSTTKKFGGTGLGLSLSKSLAERLGGTLTVKSEPEKGSQFTFCLFYKNLAGSNIVYNKESLPKDTENSDSQERSGYLMGRILLVEDNKNNQEIILLYLRRIAEDITVVDNGLLAVEAARENKFDIILMDIRMPVMDGIEATKLLRKEGFDKPIVALTANAMKEDRQACIDAGFNDFLLKPIDANTLSETIKKHLVNDKGVVSSLLENDSGAINLIRKYVSKLSTILDEIEGTINNLEWERLSDILHQLKGTGGNYGYLILTSIAEKMENHLLEQNKEKLSEDFSELKGIYSKIVQGLENTA